ncbi:MAG TPA: endonuclease NucS domain-containing protein [Puia sp.]|uniref:endonuclease NucS domain-containing protein n=1 Tax=Puia sp. TaxID=2045100 RepID=UPI002CF75319|nr:endonuclease NucS domain-containing protein [Puia sp.]HVU95305.1 endonuclease NucS domain-containing protein [Puia sp.]
MDKPAIWQMIKEAVESLGGQADYPSIKVYIGNKWGDVNENTVNAQLIALSVNQPSRVHYPQNKKPRIANGPYDILYSNGPGQVVQYRPQEHGIWEIYEKEFGALGVRLISSDASDDEEGIDQASNSLLFPLEANLRDFLIANLHTVKDYRLNLYTDPQTGRDGKEFPTDVGPIDILTQDENGDFVVFELKLSRGPDRAIGQLLRYMGWINKHVAAGRRVKGIIVANKMDEKIKYAVSVTKDIVLFEYELQFKLSKPSALE